MARDLLTDTEQRHAALVLNFSLRARCNLKPPAAELGFPRASAVALLQEYTPCNSYALNYSLDLCLFDVLTFPVLERLGQSRSAGPVIRRPH